MVRSVHVAVAGLLCIGAAAWAQDSYPLAEEEPHHRLQFASKMARIFTVEVPAGATMRYHRHPTNHLVLVVRPGRLRNDVVGRPPIEHHTGDAGTIVSVAAGSVHRQSNLGQEPARWVGIEMARSDQFFPLDGWPQVVNRGGTRSWSEGQVPWRSTGTGRAAVTLWLDEGSGERGTLIKLKPGQSLRGGPDPGAERLVPIVGDLVVESGPWASDLESGVAATMPARPAKIACRGEQDCISLVVTARR